MSKRCIACIAVLIPALLTRGVGAQPINPDPLGLTALNAAYRLTRSALSMDQQQGGMAQFQPYIYPLLSANGVELWGKDASLRADHLNFYIRYGRFTLGRPTVPIRDTDLANLIGVEHTSMDLAEHRAHQDTLRTIRARLGPMTACTRDTTRSPEGDAVAVAATAVWQRNGAQVVFHTRVLHRAPRRVLGKQRPELRLIYDVIRAGSLPTSPVGPLPTTLGAGCLIEADELESLGAPLDASAYRAWEARLRGR